MQQYEYKAILIIGGGKKTSELLTKYGKEGWELISVNWIWFYFKRLLQKKN